MKVLMILLNSILRILTEDLKMTAYLGQMYTQIWTIIQQQLLIQRKMETTAALTPKLAHSLVKSLNYEISDMHNLNLLNM